MLHVRETMWEQTPRMRMQRGGRLDMGQRGPRPCTVVTAAVLGGGSQALWLELVGQELGILLDVALS